MKHFVFFNNNVNTALQLCFLKNIERKHFTSADLEFKLLFSCQALFENLLISCLSHRQMYCGLFSAVTDVRAVPMLLLWQCCCCCSHRPTPIFPGIV